MMSLLLTLYPSVAVQRAAGRVLRPVSKTAKLPGIVVAAR
jgi:hypothetical protein